MGSNPEGLGWFHTRAFQLSVVVLLVGWAVTLISSLWSADGVPLSEVDGAGLALMLTGSVIDRHRATGRW